MSMIRLPSSQKFGLLALCVLVLTLGAYWYLIMRLIRLNEDLVVARTTEQLAAKQAQELNAVDALARETDTERQQLLSYLMSAQDPLPFIQLVERLGVDAGVELEVGSLAEEIAKTGGVVDPNAQPSVHVVLLVKGTWENVYHCLMLLETMPYLVTIETVAIEQQTESTEHGMWSGQIHLTVGLRP
jgi:hypothetical protein